MEKKYGFSREKRITDDKEIKKVLREGEVYSGTYLKIYFLSCKAHKFSVRLQNHIKGGYQRNKLRRRLREIIRSVSPQLKDGLYIIFGKKLAIDTNHKRLKEDFEKLASGGNLWRN